jgi:MFS family permease
VWRQRSFLALWSARTVSQFGTQITLFVIPVLALTTLSATPGQLGLVSAAETVPFLLIGLPAGALLDRWDRRRVMVVADLGRAVAICVLPLGYALDTLSVPLLCAVAFVTGVFTVFFDIADQALLPSVVSRAQTADGNSRLEFSRSTAELAGPSLGGLLLQLLAAPLILLADAASYLLSALLLRSVRTRHDDDQDHDQGHDQDRKHGRGDDHGHTEPRAAPESESRMRTRIAEGLRFVLTHRTLRPLALATAIGNLASLGGALSALLTAYAVHDLRLSPGALGLALSLGNAGALLGAVATGRLIRRFGLGPVLIGAKSLPGLAVLVLATAAPGALAGGRDGSALLPAAAARARGPGAARDADRARVGRLTVGARSASVGQCGSVRVGTSRSGSERVRRLPRPPVPRRLRVAAGPELEDRAGELGRRQRSVPVGVEVIEAVIDLRDEQVVRQCAPSGGFRSSRAACRRCHIASTLTP